MVTPLSCGSTGPLYFKRVRCCYAIRDPANLDVARLFNSSPILPRKCRVLLTKIGLLLYTGEKFPTNEATTLFFGISKLFQQKDPALRQMVHLIIKELASSAEDIIMFVGSPYSKDYCLPYKGSHQLL